MTWKPDVCVYHHPCNDGFAAAWAVWRRWGDDVQYIPANYGEEPSADLAGKNVLIVDFSYKFEVLDRLSFKTRSLVILDHHKTARDDLARVNSFNGPSAGNLQHAFHACWAQNSPELAAHFDMEKSGARLAWEFCHPAEPLHPLIRYVEDRDLWRNDYPDTKAFHLYLSALPKDLRRWDAIATMLEGGDPETVLDRAEAISLFYDAKIEELLVHARWAEIGGVSVPVINAPGAFASDVGHHLLELYPEAPFAATYYDAANGRRRYSLRSSDGRMDVSEVARANGGGGHRNAAGFEVAIL